MVTIDWKARKIGFENSKPSDENEWSTFGVSFGKNKDRQVVIRSVYENSLAEKIGIKVDNVVLQIGALQMSNPNGFCQYILENRDAIQEIQLIYQNSSGIRKDVVLKREMLF